MRKLANLGEKSPNQPADTWYNHHNRGSGTVIPSDNREQIESRVDREVTDRATRLHDEANRMSEHGLPKK